MLHKMLTSLGVLSLVCVAGVASATPYYLTDLGPIAPDTASYSYAVAIVNGSPVVVGRSVGSNLPVAWSSNGTPTSLLPSIPGATAGVARAIAGSGDIAGTATVGGVQKAFYLPSGGTATILPELGTGTPVSVAAGVSNGGTATGYSYNGTYLDYNGNTQARPNAVIWSGGSVVDLGTAGVPTYATAISADGNTVVGDYNNTPGQLGRAAKWTRSGSTWTMSIIVPGSVYNQSVANAVNSTGDIVGGNFDYPEGGFPSVSMCAILVKHDGTIVNLGGLAPVQGFYSARATGINDSGVIVGYDGSEGAFVNYTGTAGANVKLATLLPPSAAGWSVSSAFGIDNNGDIAARGINPVDGKSHGLLLKPAMAGDATLDGTVDMSDLSAALTNYDKSGMAWAQGDFSGDGTVDVSDMSSVLTNYNKSTSSSAVRAVPEPSTLLLLAIGLAGLTIARRQRRK